MASDVPSRRQMLTFRAWDPVTRSEFEVYVSYERLQAIAKRGAGQVLEAGELVPQILQQRGGPVWEGLRREEDEDRHGAGGWRCYCGVPDRSYTPDGRRQDTRRDRVFLVFVNEDHVAYNWRWEPADPDNPRFPQDCDENRFRRLLT